MIYAYIIVSCAFWYYLMIEIPRNNACCCSQDARLFVSSICCSTKNENLSLEVVFHHFLWEPTEIDGMLPSLAPLLVECAGKREPLCEVAGMPKAKNPLELRKVQCGWCALSVSTWFDLTFASEHHAQQFDSDLHAPELWLHMFQNRYLSVRGQIWTDTFNFNHSFGLSFFQPNKKVRWLFWG